MYVCVRTKIWRRNLLWKSYVYFIILFMFLCFIFMNHEVIWSTVSQMQKLTRRKVNCHHHSDFYCMDSVWQDVKILDILLWWENELDKWLLVCCYGPYSLCCFPSTISLIMISTGCFWTHSNSVYACSLDDYSEMLVITLLIMSIN